MKKRLILNKPKYGKASQFSFLDDTKSDYLDSSGLTLNHDKFSKKTLHTSVKESSLNDYIINWKLAYMGTSFMKIDLIQIEHTGVAGDTNNIRFRAYILDDNAYRNNGGGDIMSDSYDTFKKGIENSVVWDKTHGNLPAHQSPENPVLTDAVILKNFDVTIPNMLVPASFNGANKDYDVEASFLPNPDGVLPSEGAVNYLFSNVPGSVADTVYFIVEMQGDRDNGWWLGGTDDRNRRYQVFSISTERLYDQGMGVTVDGDDLDFQGNHIKTFEGDGSGGTWYSDSSAPAFICKRIKLTISTMPGVSSLEGVPQVIKQIAEKVTSPKKLNRRNFEESFLYQDPSQQINNLLKASQIYTDDATTYGNEKLEIVSQNFIPVTDITIANNLGQKQIDLQSYQTSSLDKQIASAPNQVSLDFYLSQKKYAEWPGQHKYWCQDDIYNVLTTLYLVNFDLRGIKKTSHGTPDAIIEFETYLSDPAWYPTAIEITAGMNNVEGFVDGIGGSNEINPDTDNAGTWVQGWNHVKLTIGALAERWWNPGVNNCGDPCLVENTGGRYNGSTNFSRIQIYRTRDCATINGEPDLDNWPCSGNPAANIQFRNFVIYEAGGFDYFDTELSDDTNQVLGPGAYDGYLGNKFLVLDWNDKDDKIKSIDDYMKAIPEFVEDLREKQQEDNTHIFSEIGTPLTHTYSTPGIKNIKSIFFTHTEIPHHLPDGGTRGDEQVIRWKFVESKIFLDIPVSQYPDFTELGFDDYVTIPAPYVTPIIGGTDPKSKYKKSVYNTLISGNIGDQDVIDETFLINDLNNDTTGQSIRSFDLQQVRYFNRGGIDMNKLLGIQQSFTVNTDDAYLSTLPFPQYREEFDVSDFMDDLLNYDEVNVFDSMWWVMPPAFRPDIATFINTVDIDSIPSAGNDLDQLNDPSYFFNPSYDPGNNTNPLTPFYDDFSYWDCSDWNGNRSRCFSEETSVGEIFISDTSYILGDMKDNCNLEFNVTDMYKKIINDSIGNGNMGFLIGDYKIKKSSKKENMRRDSFVKTPKMVIKKDGAL